MGQRLELQTLLEAICPNVYFQPPADVKLVYPCIVYQRDDADTRFAANKPYRYETRYQVTVISRTPDSDIPLKIAFLEKCVYDRFYVANNLNHDVYTLYF